MIYLWVALVFVLGAAAGAFANFCVWRLPYERSLLWPGPRCRHCFGPLRLPDWLPLVGYPLARGRCRLCGAAFSFRDYAVELLAGAFFAWLFWFEVVQNGLDLGFVARVHADVLAGNVPGAAWAVFGTHALLAFFLLITSLCDFNDMEIPLPVTLTGTVVGLTCAVLFPWPFPGDPSAVPPPPPLPPMFWPGNYPPLGLYPWPPWAPLPEWLPPGSWQLGLATGLAGALAGMLVLRGVRFVFGVGRGIEGLGVGDADLMMMAGSFVGWQPVLVGFFLSVVPGLVLGLVQIARRKGQASPFGPSLALGVLLALLCWPRIVGDRVLGSYVRGFFFEPVMAGGVGGAGAILLLAAAFFLRLVRGGPAEEGAKS
jgi:leader peptidase (prepilin peptidase) / N-methyltransferase